MIWVVDSADRRRLEDCKAELEALLVEEVGSVWMYSLKLVLKNTFVTYGVVQFALSCSCSALFMDDTKLSSVITGCLTLSSNIFSVV